MLGNFNIKQQRKFLPFIRHLNNTICNRKHGGFGMNIWKWKQSENEKWPVILWWSLWSSSSTSFLYRHQCIVYLCDRNINIFRLLRINHHNNNALYIVFGASDTLNTVKLYCALLIHKRNLTLNHPRTYLSCIILCFFMK